MANSDKTSGNIAAVITAAAGMVAAATPIINDMANKRKDKVGGNEMVVVPSLYDKRFPIKTEQAIELLIGCGLKAMPSALTFHEANIRYKDCFDGQVVDSKPKHNRKVRCGTTVFIRYITQEVIDESRRLFEEEETRKVEMKRERAEKRVQQKEQAQKIVIETADKAKRQIGKVIHRDKKDEEGEDHE